MDDDEYDFTDATENDDGSYSTDIYDSGGTPVATVTQLSDGTTQASVPVSSTTSQSTLSSLLSKASSLLSTVSNAGKTVSTDATKINNAIKGAQVGYSAPTTAAPYLIAGGIVLALIVLSSSNRR
jgi:hypothetical protein